MKKIVWLFNFSASWTGGGLVRALETIKWFNNNEGAVFILNTKLRNKVTNYSKNRYYFIKTNRIKRVINENYYLPDILDEVGTPDIYFSFGIPINEKIGKINWFHLSNALNLITHNINLSLLKKIKMKFLKKKIKKSLKIIDIATAESEFSLELLKKVNKNKVDNLIFEVLPNGYNIEKLNEVFNKDRNNINDYAISIGTYSYKRLDLVIKIFYKLRETNVHLNKIIIIGNSKYIQQNIIMDPRVEIIEFLDNDLIYNLLYNSEFYISASEIENSSIAVLESLLLSKNSILSKIPSHMELISNLDYNLFPNVINKSKFVLINNYKNREKLKFPSWNDVFSKLLSVAILKI